jgi:hypothetical protein
VNGDFDATSRLRGYGGEAQFNLNSAPGLAPFIVLGGGRMDFMDGFREEQFDATPDDQNFLVAGGGVGIRLTDNFRLNLAARDHMFSEVDLENLAQPDQLQHNWMFSAGVAYAVGRSAPDTRTMPQPVRAPAEADQPARDDTEQRASATDNRDASAESGMTRETTTTDSSALATATSSDRILQIPVPERGELYVRYGDSGKLQVTELPAQLTANQLTAAELRAALNRKAAEDGDGFTNAELNELARAVAERLDSTHTSSRAMTIGPDELRQIVREELRRLDLAEAVQDAVREQRIDSRARDDADLRVSIEQPEAEEAADEGIGSSLEQPAGYMAVAFNDPESLVFGARVDAGSMRSFPNIVFVPEVALGFPSDGTSLLAAGNLEYRFGTMSITNGFSLRPMASLGAGLLSVPDETTEGVINVNYGFSSGFGDDTSSLRWFVAHQGIDFFDRNRLAFGLTWTR